MLFIVNTKFLVGSSTQSRSNSVHEKLIMNSLSSRVQDSCPLDVGKTYRIIQIAPKNYKLLYIFEDIHTKDVVEVSFSNTSEADDFIANLSGQKEAVQSARAYQSSSFED